MHDSLDRLVMNKVHHQALIHPNYQELLYSLECQEPFYHSEY